MARVLIIEDIDFFRLRIKDIVAELGHEAVVVEPGEGENFVEAVSRVVDSLRRGEEDFDVVLMDGDLGDNPYYGLPPISGHTFAANMLQEKREEGLKLISITGNILRDSQRKLYDAHVMKDGHDLVCFGYKLGKELETLFSRDGKLPIA